MARIRVEQGDITAQATDGIVNAANNHLWMGAGVAGAIKRAGGDQIEAEAMRLGPIAVGDAVITSGGRLKARYVIHAAAMGQDLRTDADKIAGATRAALRVADQHGLRSIAMPALGTGVGGFPLDECARLMVGVARDFEATSLEEIVFVLFGEDARAAFQAALDQGA